MTTMSAVIPPPSPVPSIAAYNIRYLSLSDSSEQRAQHQRKLANVQHLVQQYTTTAILETHVTGAKAELFFCCYVEGTRRFFIHGMAVIVQEIWSLTSPGVVSIPTLLIMPHGSLMWWVSTISFTLQREFGALLVEVMTCLIHVPQIIGLWVSGGPVRRKHENLKIHLTSSFTDLVHRGCLITQNSNVLQMTVLICGLLTETVGSLVCRLLLVRCMLVAPHFSLPISSLPRQHVKGWS